MSEPIQRGFSSLQTKRAQLGAAPQLPPPLHTGGTPATKDLGE